MLNEKKQHIFVKYTASFLHKLEDVFAESDYILRYEKGNFKSGYCVLKEQKVVIVNKFYPLEGKVNCIVEILKDLHLDMQSLSDKNRNFLLELQQTELNL